MAELDFEATSRTIDGDPKLHYHDAGVGPALVLLHGSGPGVTAWHNFSGTLGAFARSFRTLALDMPGWGGSDRPDPAVHYTRAAADAVVRMLDAAGEERADFVGNSMGGGVAVRFALEHPDRTGRLVLIAPGGITLPFMTPFPTEGVQRILDFNADPSKETMLAWMRSMVGDRSVLTEEFVSDRMERALRPEEVDWSRAMYPPPGSHRVKDGAPLHSQLRKVRTPTLLMWGAADRVVPLDSAMHPLQQLPQVELHCFARCGHWTMIERREEFQRVTLEFLLRDRDAATKVAG